MSSPEHVPDDELMPRIAGGDREAFAALYQRRRLDVYRFALHMTASPASADDVTQEVFVAVIGAAHRYVPGRSGVAAWLLGIARNHVRRGIRWQRLRVPLSDASAAPRLTVVVDPLADLTRQREMTALRDALRRLPLRNREMVVLCDLQEISYADAAVIAGCAIGTVRSRLHRGRTMLAARLRRASTSKETPLVNAIRTVL